MFITSWVGAISLFLTIATFGVLTFIRTRQETRDGFFLLLLASIFLHVWLFAAKSAIEAIKFLGIIFQSGFSWGLLWSGALAILSHTFLSFIVLISGSIPMINLPLGVRFGFNALRLLTVGLLVYYYPVFRLI